MSGGSFDGLAGRPAPFASAADEARARAALALLDRRALSSNRARVDEIEAVLRDAIAGSYVGVDRVRSAAGAAHKVAGSAGSFGMHEVSELARELEVFLTRGSLTDITSLRAAVGALEEIQRQLRERRERDATAEGASHEAGVMLVAHPDRRVAARIAAAAAGRGWAARWAADATAAREALLRETPDAVLLSLDIPPDGGVSVLDADPGERPYCVTLVMGHGDRFADRIAAARAGADGFLPSDLAPEQVVDIVIDTAEQDHTGPDKVVALTEETEVAGALRDALDDTSTELTTVTDLDALWDALASTHPDLVIVDAEVAGTPGRELCRRIRTDLRWATLPVVVLVPAADVTPAAIDEVFVAGADDYATKPVVGAELQTRIANRLGRLRWQRRSARIDPLTGLLSRTAFGAAVARLAARSQREGMTLCLAILDLDGFRSLNENHDHGLGDVVLRRLSVLLTGVFRDSAVVARWGGQEVAIAMPSTRRAEGVAQLAAALDSFRRESFDAGGGTELQATFTAAVGEYGVDAPTIRSLVRTLSSAISAAKVAGGNRVVPVGWSADAGPSSPDVLVVEDDETIASLLQHAIETRRLRIEHIADGQVALDRLTGPDRITPRVILLDVELPGLNGLEVLRRIEAEGVLNRSRVIMLTIHAEESEVATALQYGAFDHVAKPFSLPALMQRLRRALDAPR
jgi:diguanylate cyclase (GGDEF)-like protein